MRRILVGSILLILVVHGSRVVDAQTPSGGAVDPPVIVAQGESILMLPADRAFVQIGAQGRAAKPVDAQRLAAAAMTSVQAALRTIGVAADMMKSTSYSLEPEYENNGARALKGYIARNVIEVRVDDLARLPAVLDSAGSSGAASVSGLRFDLKNRGAAELDALHRAVRDANERAQAIAEGAGRTLGPILRLEEQRTADVSPVYVPSVAETVTVSSATPVDPGQVQVSALVTLTIAIR